MVDIRDYGLSILSTQPSRNSLHRLSDQGLSILHQFPSQRESLLRDPLQIIYRTERDSFKLCDLRGDVSRVGKVQNHESRSGLCSLVEDLFVDEETVRPGRYQNQIRILKLVSNCLKRDRRSSEGSAERLCLLTVSPSHKDIMDSSCLH